MFNLVALTGRLTADPELKMTTNGISVCSFTIAVDRRVKSGEDKQTDFINIVTWRGSAEFVSKYFKKGNVIGIEGAIQTRKYTDKDGNNRTTFEVVANNVQFVEGKKADNNVGASDETKQSFVEANFTEVSNDDDLPF
jgi:single-strand DNA-binding protein